MKRILKLITILLFCHLSNAQRNVFDILNNNDLTFDVRVDSAENYLINKGDTAVKERKHFERWKFDSRLHLNHKGYLRTRQEEKVAYQIATSKMIKSTGNTTWVELGPKTFNRTTSWNPGVGRVTSVLVNPVDTNIVYVSSPGGGIWKTTDHAQNWVPLINEYEKMNVYNLCMDPNNPNIIYAALQNAGIIKSINAGSTWQNTGSGPNYIKKIIVDPSNSNRILAAGFYGVHISTNGGTTWTQTASSYDVHDIEFKPGNSSIVYASGYGGVLKSSDGGSNWSSVGAGSVLSDERTMLGVSPQNPSVLYVVQSAGSGFGRLLKSTDSGQTFSMQIIGDYTQGTNYFGYTGFQYGGQAWYDMAITVNPTNANELIIAGIICWRSTDGGLSFEQLTEWFYPNTKGYNHADVHALEWVGNTIYSGSDGGIYKSFDNGFNWTDLSAGLSIKQLYRIANSPTNALIMSGGSQDNGTIVRQASGTFVDWLGADGMENIINPKNDQIIIGAIQNGGLNKTINGGNSSVNITTPGPGNWVTPLLWHPTDSSTIYGGYNYIFKSTDMGTSWTNISAPLGYVGYFNDMAISYSNPDVIYASINNRLYVTKNGGTSWTTINYPSYINDIAVKPSEPGKIYVAMGSASTPLVMSTDYGATYTNVSTGLPSLSASSVIVNDDSNEEVLVGMTIGVYYKNQSNPSWQLFGTGLPEVQISEIDIAKEAGKIRVATYGRGIWETSLKICPINISHAGNITANEYQAEKTITSEANVATGTKYFAGEHILLNPGFQAGSMENFEAKIGGCSN